VTGFDTLDIAGMVQLPQECNGARPVHPTRRKPRNFINPEDSPLP